METGTFKYRTNLARKMSAPGGLTIREAISRAEAGLELHREDAMTGLAEALSGLEASCAGRAVDCIYDEAAALLDTAGFFNTGPLYMALFSLCEISSRMTETGAWDWPSIEVHVRAVRLILAEGCRETEGTRVIIDGLAAVARRTAG